MRAIILAAGVGSRLRPLTNDRPKCLVTVGEKALVDHQIDALRSEGVDDIVLVVGCKADQVRAHCGDRSDTSKMLTTTVQIAFTRYI